MKNSSAVNSKLTRREKQRLENPLRAKKMNEARLEYEKSGKKISLNNSKQKFYIGCSGWFYWDWKGLFYPAEISTNNWFDYYAKNFDTVELNAPFYSWPTVATVKSWIRQAASHPNFTYTIKVSELITHSKRFARTKTLIKDFGLIADLLAEKMGCFLFQLPPSFKYSAARLKLILNNLDLSRRNVVEFRHKSWWNEKVYTEFRQAGIIFCSCSGPNLPDDLIKTADEIYLRFHGIKKWYRHDYSKEELQIWAKKIQHSKAKKAWIYFNNDHDAYAIKNAKELRKMLS